MKRLETIFLAKMVFIFAGLIIFTGISGNAQDNNLDQYTKKPKPSTGKKPSSAPTRTIYVKGDTKIVKTIVPPPTILSVSTTPNADVKLELIGPKKGVKSFKNTGKADINGAVDFKEMKAGKYKLSSFLAGYHPEEFEIAVEPNKTTIKRLPLTQITYDFPIRTNVKRGEVRFAPLKKDGQNPDGTPNLVPTGNYCVVVIENQKAVVKGLAQGYYNLDVSSPDAPEYEPKQSQIRIPEDIKVNSNEVIPSDVVLTNRQSTGTFSLSSVQDDWILPAENWKLDTKGILRTEGIGVALPKSSNFRYFKDFEMQSTVRLLNDDSIGFVVRAKDEKNYYLIQLTGSKSKNEYLVTGSIVKDGKETERVISNPIKSILKDVLNDHKYFDVVIKAKGDTFQILAENGTGELKPLGNAVFKDNNFPIGAVGLSNVDKSGFEVGRFIVCNEICK